MRFWPSKEKHPWVLETHWQLLNSLCVNIFFNCHQKHLRCPVVPAFPAKLQPRPHFLYKATPLFQSFPLTTPATLRLLFMLFLYLESFPSPLYLGNCPLQPSALTVLPWGKVPRPNQTPSSYTLKALFSLLKNNNSGRQAYLSDYLIQVFYPNWMVSLVRDYELCLHLTPLCLEKFPAYLKLSAHIC